MKTMPNPEYHKKILKRVREFSKNPLSSPFKFFKIYKDFYSGRLK